MMAWSRSATIRFRHLGNLREHVTFPIRLFRARASARFRLQLFGALLYCDVFLVRESRDRLGGHPQSIYIAAILAGYAFQLV